MHAFVRECATAEQTIPAPMTPTSARLRIRPSDHSLELALQPGIADLPDLQGQPHPRRRSARRALQLGRAPLREPHDPRVVVKVVVTQLGIAVEAEAGPDGTLEAPREEIGQEV